ncbi:helix-turn-helix domain-containing protein [Dysgonomonas termitidis]|uniref:Helix-turn-helix domain-containing protein n=1 Tax=Dysgonomonas termitidis TaxID=1516126 RepID=A0ABV9L3T6_9BACT
MKEKKITLEQIDYNLLKKKAYDLVVIQGRPQKEAANILNLSEKTLSVWSKSGNWQELKADNEIVNFRKFLSDKIFDLMADIALIDDKELRTRIANKLTGKGGVL